jgi:hypothetical protein
LHRKKIRMKNPTNGQSYKNYHAIEKSAVARGRQFGAIVIVLITFMHMPCYAQKWDKLFNGKNLKGWETYIGPAYDSVASKFTGTPPGLNKDPDKVFSVVVVDGRPAIRVSGASFGGLSTISNFSNYHFRISFKWGDKKHAPRKNDKRDSGVLYHAVGKHGADGGFWMRSQEFQVQEGDCGDYWGVAGGSFEIPAVKTGEQFVFSPDGELLTFNESSAVGRRCIKQFDKELAKGEWNTLEIICVGDISLHIMNGTIVMTLMHSAQLENGTLIPLTAGKIQLQSEGAEIFYRDAEIKPLNSIPVK